MPRHFIKRRRRAIPPVCLPVPLSSEAETHREIESPMQQLLSLLQSLSDQFADFGRNSTRRSSKPLLLAIAVAIGYIVFQPAERYALWSTFRSALLDNEAERRLQEQSVLQAELRQFSSSNRLIYLLLASMLCRAAGASCVRL